MSCHNYSLGNVFLRGKHTNYQLNLCPQSNSLPFAVIKNLNSLFGSHSAPWQKFNLSKFKIRVDSHFLKAPTRSGGRVTRSSVPSPIMLGSQRGPQPPILCDTVLAPPSVCLCVSHPCHSGSTTSCQKFSHYPGLEETQKVCPSTCACPGVLGTFLDSSQERVASVSQTHPGCHSFSPNLGPGTCRTQEPFSKPHFSQYFSSRLHFHSGIAFPVCLSPFFFPLITYSLCPASLKAMLLKLQNFSF